jgi:hypothetical protein
MLQLQYIKDHTDEIIARLKIKNVQNVEERIAEIIAIDADRRAMQVKADAVKAEQNRMAKEIGMLMKQGKREEAEAMKAMSAERRAEGVELAAKQAEAERALADATNVSTSALKNNAVAGGYSAGADMRTLAAFMSALGCQSAYNMDGGASSVMIFHGQTINHPAENGRDVNDMIVACDGKEGEE